MPKLTPKPAKKTYAKRVPKTVSFLTEEQVRRVISETFPERPADSPEFVSLLQTGINNALGSMVPLLRERMPDIEGLQKAFAALNKKLTKPNRRLLEELGGAHSREIDRLSPPGSATPAATIRLQGFLAAFHAVQIWLADPKARDVVTGRREPLADLQTVAGHSLPDLYQMIFRERFGTGLSGNGPRFVEAVLREAGIEPDYPERIPERVRMSRKRALKPKSLIRPKNRKGSSPE